MELFEHREVAQSLGVSQNCADDYFEAGGCGESQEGAGTLNCGIFASWSVRGWICLAVKSTSSGLCASSNGTEQVDAVVGAIAPAILKLGARRVLIRLRDQSPEVSGP